MFDIFTSLVAAKKPNVSNHSQWDKAANPGKFSDAEAKAKILSKKYLGCRREKAGS
jgi:hypothetical protein